MPGHLQQPPHQQAEANDHQQASEEARFFTQGAEDEVCVLFGDEAQFGELSLEETCAEQSAGADANGALEKVIPPTQRIFAGIQEQHQAVALIVLQHDPPENRARDHGGDLDKAHPEGCHALPGQRPEGQKSSDRGPDRQACPNRCRLTCGERLERLPRQLQRQQHRQQR